VVVGAGPAGSACAAKLRSYGLDVVMLDKEKFPRHKACAGLVSAAAWQELGLDPAEYAKGRVFQPVFGFRTSSMGGPVVETRYDHPIGYGILRSEFDQYLVERSGVWLLDGEEVKSLERESDGWIVNKGLKASIIVGAGGHSCPVAQYLGSSPSTEQAVTAKMVEYRLEESALENCALEPDMPEIYFCPDLQGFGWCLRKGNFINLGLGRSDRKRFGEHFSVFLGHLKLCHKVPGEIPDSYAGHRFLLFGASRRRIVADRALVIGDAAGLACRRSGEGIRPAIESGLLAARAILDAGGDYSRARLETYHAALSARFEPSVNGRLNRFLDRTPGWIQAIAARRMLSSIRFTRQVVINRWFLHADEPPFAY